MRRVVILVILSTREGFIALIYCLAAFEKNLYIVYLPFTPYLSFAFVFKARFVSLVFDVV